MSRQCTSCGGDCKGDHCERSNITFTREEVKKHEQTVELLRNEISALKIKIANVSSDCKEEFERWYGFPIDQDMDISTSIAWENWQVAWNLAMLSKQANKGELK